MKVLHESIDMIYINTFFDVNMSVLIALFFILKLLCPLYLCITFLLIKFDVNMIVLIALFFSLTLLCLLYLCITFLLKKICNCINLSRLYLSLLFYLMASCNIS